METLHVNVARRRRSIGLIAVARLTNEQNVARVRVPTAGRDLPNQTLGAVVKTALKHHVDGCAACAECWLRLGCQQKGQGVAAQS